MRAMNCLTYALRLSAYRRWPSANRVSMVRDDLPDPETPVTTTSLFRGIATVTFLRLWTLAPFINMESWGIPGSPAFFTGLFLAETDIIEPAKIPRHNEC